MDLNLYLLFLLTTMVVVFAPGPTAIAIATQGAANGVRRALFGVFGVALANFIYFLLSATGVTSLILTTGTLFSIIKWLGVAYLMYLGLNTFFSKTGGIQLDQQKITDKNNKLFRQGLLVELANPKAILYFSALIPQFIDPSRPILLQMIIMSSTCFLVDLVSYSTYAYLGDTIAKDQ